MTEQGNCTRCKGTGTMILRVVTIDDNGVSPEVPCEITCIYCDGSGMDKGKVFLEDTIDWCKCGDAGSFGSYPLRDECSCGVRPEHCHCGECGKIFQLG